MAADMSAVFEKAGLKPPRVLTLAVTDACNLFCTHCWVEAKPQAMPMGMPTLAVRRMIEEFAQLGGEGIRLTGGEPLLHPDWLEFIDFALHLGVSQVELQTNALLLREKEVAALRKFPATRLKFHISLDGAFPESHDWLRGSGSFSGALAGIRQLVAAGFGERVVIFFTETAHNLAEFPDLLALGEGLGVGSVISGTLIAGGRAAEGQKVVPPEPDQYLDLLRRYQTDARFRELYGALGTMAALEWWIGNSPDRPCCSLVENPYLTPSGKLYPCLLCHNDAFAVSGVLDQTLGEVFRKGVDRWSALKETAEGRAKNISLCRNCPERSICAAGCIGRAWGSCGDLLAPDDRCETRRLIGKSKRSQQKNP